MPSAADRADYLKDHFQERHQPLKHFIMVVGDENRRDCTYLSFATFRQFDRRQVLASTNVGSEVQRDTEHPHGVLQLGELIGK